jgi:hypothetical protein
MWPGAARFNPVIGARQRAKANCSGGGNRSSIMQSIRRRNTSF